MGRGREGLDGESWLRAAAAVALYCLCILGAWTGAGLLHAPRADLGGQLLAWGAASVVTTRPVEELLGAGDPEGRPWLRIALSSALIAVAVAPTGLGFLFPVAAGWLTTQTLQLHPTRGGLAAGLLAVATGTAALQVASHAGVGLQVLPPTTADLSAMVLAVVSLVGLVNAHRVGRRLRTAAEELAAEQARRHRELLHAATHDQLTGLLGRRGLEGHLTRAVAQARPGEGVGLVFLDLDGFKPVNDTHGHDAGDAVLRGVADRLRGAVTDPSPAPGPVHDVRVARVGGDEFVVLVGATCAQDVHRVAFACADALRAPFTVAGTGLSVGASIGTAYVEEPVPVHEVTRTADAAMYDDKRRRRARAREGLRQARAPRS